MRAVEEAAPAKINLDLIVLGRRADRFHELDSLVVFADVADRLTVSLADDLELVVTGPAAAGVPTDETNLVVRAARLLAAAAGRSPAVRLDLEKHLPAAAGIGGGSSDAAATLRALDRLWGLGLGSDRLETLGRELGADVPVCVRGRPVRMRGIGERLEPAAPLRPLHVVLVNPGVQVPTGPVFRELAAPSFDPGRAPQIPSLDERLAAGRNDLEGPARRLEPIIGDVLAAIRDQDGLRAARMSGSGATCFGWFENATQATAAASELGRRHPDWWVRAAVCGP